MHFQSDFGGLAAVIDPREFGNAASSQGGLEPIERLLE
jgi:hypothetical protein